MIVLNLTPNEHDLIMLALKIAADHHEKEGLHYLSAQTEKLMYEIDITEEEERKVV